MPSTHAPPVTSKSGHTSDSTSKQASELEVALPALDAFTEELNRLAAINAANLGGHNDWRIPSVKELQGIMDYSKAGLASSVPGSTAAANYWSSTTFAGVSSLAWLVNFSDGFVNNDDKNNSLSVRAVRGGW